MTELVTYRQIEQELLRRGLAGKFAVIHGDELIGVFDSVDRAWAEVASRPPEEGWYLIQEIQPASRGHRFRLAGRKECHPPVVRPACPGRTEPSPSSPDLRAR